MNKFDERYDIRFAHYSEIPSVMKYIDEFWKKGHILATNRDFFEYEYVIDGHVNFLIAVNKDDGKIEGVLGYIPASRSKDKLDIWGVVWRVCDDAMSMLGIELKKRLIQYTDARTELGVGANPKTSAPLLKLLLHYQVNKMRHFYMLSDCVEFKIAKIIEKKETIIESGHNIEIVRYYNIEQLNKEFDFASCEQCIPYKDSWYINHRYFDYPIYHYKVYGLKEHNIAKALLVIREQEYNGSKAIRIVDYVGDAHMFAGLNPFFIELLHNAEYIDLYCHGLPEEVIFAAGMVERTEEDPNIIPNYFSPYECKNIDIYVDSTKPGCLFFKADGDQDRPN